MSSDSQEFLVTKVELRDFAESVVERYSSEFRSGFVIGGAKALHLYADVLAKMGDDGSAARARSFAAHFETALKK